MRKRELLDRFIDGLPDSVQPPSVVDHYEEELSQSEESPAPEEPEQLESRRPRNRRPPVWMEDYVADNRLTSRSIFPRIRCILDLGEFYCTKGEKCYSVDLLVTSWVHSYE